MIAAQMGNLAGLRDLHKTQLRTEKLECNLYYTES